MEPRLGSRGKPRETNCFYRVSLPRFNGAATWKSRKGTGQGLPAFRRTASMEPRLGSRGKSSQGRALPRDRRASMEPRLGSRGKPILTKQKNTLLRWCFNGAATWKSRKGRYQRNFTSVITASMEPRLGSRGKTRFSPPCGPRS